MTLLRPSRLSPNQKVQLWPNPPATTREQKPNRPETCKPSPTPDAHSLAHLHVFLQPRPTHHSRSTRTRALDLKTCASTRDRCTRVALLLCHVARLQRNTPRLWQLNRLGGGFLAPAAYSARKTCFRPVYQRSDPPEFSFNPV